VEGVEEEETGRVTGAKDELLFEGMKETVDLDFSPCNFSNSLLGFILNDVGSVSVLECCMMELRDVW
jgi:hypothetical protein